MAAHNEELAAIVTRRFRQLAEKHRLSGDMMNEAFHDSHRPQLARSFREALECVAGGARSVPECETAAAAESVWPELLNSTAFKALFSLQNGLAWRHLRRYTSAVAPKRVNALPDAIDIWATYHADGIAHGSHSHDGSQLAGVYYVREAGEDERGGRLLLEDPRHIQLGNGRRNRISQDEHVVEPTPGRLAFWPAYLQHEVTATIGSRPRISLAIDLGFHGENGALWPRQVKPATAEARNEAQARPASASEAVEYEDGLGLRIRPFVCRGMPSWMRRSVLSNSGDDTVLGSGVEEHECPPGGLPLFMTPPSYEGAARAVDRVRGLNASEFYRRYARPGLPVVLEGALTSEGMHERAETIRKCCADEYARKAAVAAGQGPNAPHCDIYDPSTWCERGVQLCGRHPEYDCASAATLDATSLPADLRQVLTLPAPLPPIDWITAQFHEPYVFWSQPGDTFGGVDHFDMICTGTLSMQHRGRKAWALWAPWDLIGADGVTVPGHTRFEAIAHAGDAVYYPPGWFHTTKVEAGGKDGESLTAAVDLSAVPAFGTLAGRSLRTPFGYGSCASGDHGWHAQSARWDRELLGLEPVAAEACKAPRT